MHKLIIFLLTESIFVITSAASRITNIPPLFIWFKVRLINRHMVITKVWWKTMFPITSVNGVAISPTTCTRFLVSICEWRTIATTSSLRFMIIYCINVNLWFIWYGIFELSTCCMTMEKILLMIGKWFMSKIWERNKSKESFNLVRNLIEQVMLCWCFALLIPVMQTQLHGHSQVGIRRYALSSSRRTFKVV